MDFDKRNITELEQRVKSSLKIDNVNIPEDINISTMTIEAKFDTTFIPLNIYKYINRDPNNIIRVNIRNTGKCSRFRKKLVLHEQHSIFIQKKKMTNCVKRKAEFLNQVTAIVNVSKKKNNMPVSVKIFRNGTLHFTGCHTIENVLEVAQKICFECKKVRAVITKNKKIKEIKFAENTPILKLENLHDFKIDMINSNFVVPFEIDRPKLYNKLKNDQYDVYYDSNKHAAVNITYKKGLTLFVFESGSIIIIVGNDGFNPINEGYYFIYEYLLKNYRDIVKDNHNLHNSLTKLLKSLSE